MAVHITTMKATEKPISNYYEYEKKKKEKKGYSFAICTW